jgi:hypothetical protein
MARSLLLAPLALTLVAACTPLSGTPAAMAVFEPLGGLTFKPVSAANAQLVASQAVRSDASGGTGTSAPAAMPVAPAPGKPTGDGSPGAYSGNVYGYYGWGWYYGGSEEMAMVAFQEAEVAGATGELPEAARSLAAPIIDAWATDARLVQSGGQLRADGTLYPASPAPGSTSPDAYNGAWRLVYVSSSRKEVLQLLVRAESTLVLRQRWEPLHLAPERIRVGAKAAIERLSAAIRDPNAKSEEERTGKDYFMGFGFNPPQTWQGPEQRTEVVHDVPADARWDTSLQQVMGRLVWQLGFSTYGPVAMAGVGSAPAVAPAAPGSACPTVSEPMTYFNNAAQGMVDAETGTVIRFSRPTRTTYTITRPDPSCSPVPTTPKSAGG